MKKSKVIEQELYDAKERKVARREYHQRIADTPVNNHEALDKLLSEAVHDGRITHDDYEGIQTEASKQGWGSAQRMKVTFVGCLFILFLFGMQSCEINPDLDKFTPVHHDTATYDLFRVQNQRTERYERLYVDTNWDVYRRGDIVSSDQSHFLAENKPESETHQVQIIAYVGTITLVDDTIILRSDHRERWSGKVIDTTRD